MKKEMLKHLEEIRKRHLQVKKYLKSIDGKTVKRYNSDYGVKGMKWGHRKAKSANGYSIPNKEKAHINSEISTWYHKRFSGKVGQQCGIEVKDKYYFFVNNGFGDYDIYKRIDIVGNEDLIDKLERKMQK
ncbi:MAG: hypothetical protein IJK60_10020 [Clostridia bacterium]|nr:hypothetical protein [Clostridia bacterium]